MGTDIPEIQFAPAPGGRIAFQSWGVGAIDVVAIPPSAQNIEMAWQSPLLRKMFVRLGSFSRYVHFDKRGTGVSDRKSLVAGIDERVEDLRAVMDAAHVERAFLFAQSEGGPMALLFAATYPERVSGLVLAGTGAALFPSGFTEQDRDEQRSRHREFAARWGTSESTAVDLFAPSLADDLEFRTWHQAYERSSASSDSLVDLLGLALYMDAREVLGRIEAPTLVIHRTEDQVVPVELGRELAAMIPNATLFEEPGQDHFAYVGETEGWLGEMERFVTGTVLPRPAPLVQLPVRISSLGGFGVEVGGELVPSAVWGSRLARQLCKRLVAARGWPVTRDEFFDLFWPDEVDRAKVGARLSVLLSNVRRVLGGGVIADRDTIRLDMNAVTTDVEAVMDTDDDLLVMELYAGEFLPEDRYDDWSSTIRDQVRAKFVEVAWRVVAQSESDGDLDTAVESLYRIVKEDRYSSEAHGQLVGLLIKAGRVGAAKRAHQSWAEAMSELGVDSPPTFRP